MSDDERASLVERWRTVGPELRMPSQIREATACSGLLFNNVVLDTTSSITTERGRPGLVA